MKKNQTSFFGRVLWRVALALCTFASGLASAQPSQVGQWQNGPNFPNLSYVPRHSHLLPDSTVIFWTGDQQGISQRWDPKTGAVTSVASADFNIFCTAHSFLPDGRLFVAGGHVEDGIGLPEASIYNPVNNTWTRQPRMNQGRWYPTTTVLPNGDVLVVSGEVDATVGINNLPQVWESATGTWRNLTSAQLPLSLYPSMFLAPNGSVFNAGPEVTTRYLDTAGTGAWANVGNRTFPKSRFYGGAVMYEPGKILTVGGGDPPTNTAEVIDLNASNPSWRAVASMATARQQMNSTVLADGKVLVTGGTSGAGFNNINTPVLTAELWDPASEASVTQGWTTMAPGTIPRLYHSIALLLPDARVLVGGGDGYKQTEIFSPPYLFAGARPTISSAPETAGRGQSIFVGTPDATGINSVTWVALGSVTHSVNMSQAVFRSTSITQGSGGINITAPNDPTVPPGFYMLFLLRNGVPSEAKIVQLGPQSSNPLPSISAISPASAASAGAAFSLSVTGANFSNVSTVRWNGVDRPTTFVSATQLTAAIAASDIAAAGTAQVSVSNPGLTGGTSQPLAFTISATTPSGTDNPAPTLTSIAPASVSEGAAAFTLTANGTGFVSTSKVHWNGAERPTTFVSATQLQATIAAGDVAAVGSTQVSVQTPAPGGGVSAAQAFTIASGPPPVSNLVPALTTLAPASAPSGSAAFTLTVNGSNFVAGSTVRWNGVARTTTFVSATRVTAAIPVTDLAAAGSAQVTVFNPTPGGGVSPSLLFTISSGQNLTAAGTIIAKITAPTGGGSRNIQIIRDGVMPAPSTAIGWTNQYDTFDGANAAADDWIGYQFASPQTFNRVMFQEGVNFGDGGWFNSLTVQVRQGGNWVAVSGLTSTPAYPGRNNGLNYESYNLQFAPISGDAIRLYGAPGGSSAFISAAELLVYGP